MPEITAKTIQKTAIGLSQSQALGAKGSSISAIRSPTATPQLASLEYYATPRSAARIKPQQRYSYYIPTSEFAKLHMPEVDTEVLPIRHLRKLPPVQVPPEVVLDERPVTESKSPSENYEDHKHSRNQRRGSPPDAAGEGNISREQRVDKRADKRADNAVEPEEKSASYVPTLTLEGYFSEPAIDMMKEMSEDELAHIQDFTVGHPDYGKITWPGETDVRNLDLDSIIKFGEGLFELYPEPVAKPPPNQGLNKEAEITLFNIWPRRKSDKEITKEPDSLERYERRLRRNKKTEFVSYNREVGEWTFRIAPKP